MWCIVSRIIIDFWNNSTFYLILIYGETVEKAILTNPVIFRYFRFLNITQLSQIKLLFMRSEPIQQHNPTYAKP